MSERKPLLEWVESMFDCPPSMFVRAQDIDNWKLVERLVEGASEAPLRRPQEPEL